MIQHFSEKYISLPKEELPKKSETTRIDDKSKQEVRKSEVKPFKLTKIKRGKQ